LATVTIALHRYKNVSVTEQSIYSSVLKSYVSVPVEGTLENYPDVMTNKVPNPFIDQGFTRYITIQDTSPAPVVTVPAIYGVSGSPSPVGSLVTITGNNFGSTQATSTVTFNGSLVTSVTSWSSSSIQCTIPAGATTGNVIVTVGGQVSNGYPYTVGSPVPVVYNLNPTLAEIGATITIAGNNFGDTRGTSVVSFDGIEGVTYPLWTNSVVQCVVPPGVVTGLVTLVVGGQESNGFLFTVGSPTTAGIAPLREEFTLSDLDIANKYVTLSQLTVIPTSVTLSVDSAPSLTYGDDYVVTGNRVSWEDKEVDGILSVGDYMEVLYMYTT